MVFRHLLGMFRHFSLLFVSLRQANTDVTPEPVPELVAEPVPEPGPESAEPANWLNRLKQLNLLNPWNQNHNF